ncbi:MAG: addiction module toxin, HicA family [Dehalococcoidia bacterium]|nr:addiction module toxin, HicA family [Dehalococcoidia bacterium]
MPSRRVVRALERLGFGVRKVEGSHYHFRHPDGRRLVIPFHGEVRVGLLLDSLKLANITWEAFEEALH